MSQTTSQAGIDLITSFEGYYANWYLDPVGVRTVGYGHTDERIPKGISVPLSREEALDLLRHDLAGYEAAVRRLVKVPLSQPQFDALVSFAFNVGTGALASSTLLRRLNARDYRAAAAQFAKWVHGGGQVLPGLVRRRQAEAALFQSAAKPVTGRPAVSVRTLQALLNRYFRGVRLPVRVVPDGQLGPRTREAISIAKLSLGYKAAYANGRRTPLLYAALRAGRLPLKRQQARGRAWRDLYLHGNGAAAVARRILASPRARFLFSSPTGGTARAGLQAVARGDKAPVAATGGTTTVSLDVLRFLDALLRRAHGPVLINCLTNGSHRAGSKHYTGQAVDIDKTSGVTSRDLQAAASEAGVHVLDEDSAHWHIYEGSTP